jgi:hypothetical protein
MELVNGAVLYKGAYEIIVAKSLFLVIEQHSLNYICYEETRGRLKNGDL